MTQPLANAATRILTRFGEAATLTTYVTDSYDDHGDPVTTATDTAVTAYFEHPRENTPTGDASGANLDIRLIAWLLDADAPSTQPGASGTAIRPPKLTRTRTSVAYELTEAYPEGNGLTRCELTDIDT